MKIKAFALASSIILLMHLTGVACRSTEIVKTKVKHIELAKLDNIYRHQLDLVIPIKCLNNKARYASKDGKAQYRLRLEFNDPCVVTYLDGIQESINECEVRQTSWVCLFRRTIYLPVLTLAPENPSFDLGLRIDVTSFKKGLRLIGLRIRREGEFLSICPHESSTSDLIYTFEDHSEYALAP